MNRSIAWSLVFLTAVVGCGSSDSESTEETQDGMHTCERTIEGACDPRTPPGGGGGVGGGGGGGGGGFGVCGRTGECHIEALMGGMASSVRGGHLCMLEAAIASCCDEGDIIKDGACVPAKKARPLSCDPATDPECPVRGGGGGGGTPAREE